MSGRSVLSRALVLALLATVAVAGLEGTRVQPAQAAHASQLARYPYLTDVVQGYATVNFGTDRSGASASVTYGKVGAETCSATR